MTLTMILTQVAWLAIGIALARRADEVASEAQSRGVRA
jgi:hypothetical protein